MFSQMGLGHFFLNPMQTWKGRCSPRPGWCFCKDCFRKVSMRGEDLLREVGELDSRVWDRQLFGGESEESADCRSWDPEANQAQLQKAGGREGRKAVH